jgi:hypothetical protein
VKGGLFDGTKVDGLSALFLGIQDENRTDLGHCFGENSGREIGFRRLILCEKSPRVRYPDHTNDLFSGNDFAYFIYEEEGVTVREYAFDVGSVENAIHD